MGDKSEFGESKMLDWYYNLSDTLKPVVSMAVSMAVCFGAGFIIMWPIGYVYGRIQEWRERT